MQEASRVLPRQQARPVLGILGGMGPAASCYLYEMLIAHTPAKRDQDHIDIILSSRASTPDRTAYITKESDVDPLPILQQDAQALVAYGATVLLIPCNTAHYFYSGIAQKVSVPVLHMPALVVADAKKRGCKKLGILATDGTLRGGVYRQACLAQNLPCAEPSAAHQRDVMRIIYEQIKQGKRADMAAFSEVAADLTAQGCTHAVLGCTELSLVKRDEHLPDDFFLDSTEVLCRAALEACGVQPVGF